MSPSITELMDAREADLQQELLALEQALARAAAIRAELEQIRRARHAMATGADVGHGGRRSRRRRAELTIKGMILAVLREVPEGLSGADVVTAVQAKFGRAVPRTSLAPQLSRLGQAGDVTMLHGIWRIAGAAA